MFISFAKSRVSARHDKMRLVAHIEVSHCSLFRLSFITIAGVLHVPHETDDSVRGRARALARLHFAKLQHCKRNLHLN